MMPYELFRDLDLNIPNSWICNNHLVSVESFHPFQQRKITDSFLTENVFGDTIFGVATIMGV